MPYDLEGSLSMMSQSSLYSATTDKVVQLAKEYFQEANHPADPQGSRKHRKPSSTIFHLVLVGGDTILLVAVLTLTLLLSSHLGLELGDSRYLLGSWDMRLALSCLAILSWTSVARVTRAHSLMNASNRFRGPLSVLFALMLMLILWLIFTYPFITNGERIPYIRVLLLFLVLSISTVSAWRVVFAEIMNLSRFHAKAVIVGVNAAGETLATELRNARRSGIDVLGFIDENAQQHRKDSKRLPILGDASALRRLVQHGVIDMIVMAIDYRVDPDLFQEAIGYTQSGISVVPMAVVSERATGKIPVKYIGDQWSMALPLEYVISPRYLCWSKVVDFIAGLIGTAVLLLILPILALLIYLDSPGPIFYRQERLGQQGKPFRIYKFRSMHTDAEKSGIAVWASAYDPRITRIGRFMRKTHLDELPQVLNILRGDVSLIGPRPERQEFSTELEKTVPFYRCRLTVKPGITGWAQVKYRYGNTDNDALIKLQYDLYYIKHQSVILDLFILLKTGAEVLLCRGT